MKNDQKYRNKYRISSTRLKYYDYAKNGVYFVTMCTKNRECFFGDVKMEKMNLSEIGKIAQKYWLEIPQYFSYVTLGECVIMPNHVHGVVIIDNNNAETLQPIQTLQCIETLQCTETLQCNVSTNDNYHSTISPNPKSLSTIIRSYKSICTKTINTIQNKIFFAWQPRFYEHIVRNNIELHRISDYIINNPINWQKDDYYHD